jgi:hypothetical protein
MSQSGPGRLEQMAAAGLGPWLVRLPWTDRRIQADMAGLIGQWCTDRRAHRDAVRLIASRMLPTSCGTAEHRLDLTRRLMLDCCFRLRRTGSRQMQEDPLPSP